MIDSAFHLELLSVNKSYSTNLQLVSNPSLYGAANFTWFVCGAGVSLRGKQQYTVIKEGLKGQSASGSPVSGCWCEPHWLLT